MSSDRKVVLSVFLTLMMATLPWAAADLSNWAGPPQIASSGQDVEVDGWNVPSNATILDGWLTAEDQMVGVGNGSEWRTDTTRNFSVGQYIDSTMDHFDGRLSIEPDDAVSEIDSFVGVATLQFEHSTIQESGNTSIWEPGIPSLVNGTQVGNTMQMPYGVQPANAHGGTLVAATLMNRSVPAGIDASFEAGVPIPSPVNHFNLSFWHWQHTDVNDGMWLEYKLDNGPWTWVAPNGGYNSNITLNSSATPAGTPNSSSTFPVWTSVNATGWVQELVNLDNLPNINTSVNINFRWRIVTDANSSASPGWFVDDLEITNVGGSTGYWHHGCYTVTAASCGYSNNAQGLLTGTVDLTNAGSGSEIQVRVEWDLEGSGWDNFCIELSSNGNAWTDISSSTTSTTSSCRSRSGAIPGNGYTLPNGTTYGDQSNGFVTLELAIPSTFHNSGSTQFRIRVDTDSSVTYGSPQDSQEGLTVDRITVVAANGSILDDDPLSNSTTMTASGLNGATQDWNYISIGAGAFSETYGFEDSTATAPTPMAPGWRATGDWEYGALQTTTLGPISFPSGPFGMGTHLDGGANDGSIDHLYSPPYTIPAGASARLTFDHWMCAYENYAGGAVFISTDNNTWTHFDPGNNWYDKTGYTWGSGTLSSVGIFDGSNIQSTSYPYCQGPRNLWETKVADLTSYSGQTVWFRFTYEPYSSTFYEHEGWYIDDVGLEVDYFYEEGNWISDAIQVDDLGAGFIDVDGMIAEDTWATASILDISGNVIDGFYNLSFPVSLHGLDKDAHQSIRVQINMGTDNPFLTPIIEAVHVGSIRLLDARGSGNGWDVTSGLDLWNGNLTNNGSAVQQISSDFIHSSRPITSVDFTGIGSQVAIRAIDSSGTVIGNTGLSGTITFAEPQPGFGVQINVNPGGHISTLWAEGEFGQPAVNPEVDVTSDGTVDWSFPEGNAFGVHGWQQMLYQTTSSTTTTTHVQDTASSGIATDSSTGSSISVLVPEDATVRTTTISLDVTSPTGAVIDLTIGSSASQTFAPGSHTVSLSPAMIAYMNMVQPSYTDTQTGRLWRVVEFDFDTTGYAVLDIKAITVGYSILENVTGLTSQMVDFHRVEIATAGESVDIPMTYNADAGAVIFDGGIHHELMITNYPFTVPNTLYPDGNVVEITTQHRHLYDNDDIAKITLTGAASDGNTIEVEVTNPATNPMFTQSSGSLVLPMESDCSVSESAGLLEVKWRFLVSWTWDDVAQIDWNVLSQNITGEAIAPAVAQSGGTGSQAVENDLEISGFEVFDQEGRHLSNQFSPDYPFPALSGNDLTVMGTVRFQNTIDLRPQQSDFAIIVNISGHEISVPADGQGTFSGDVMVEPAQTHTLSPRVGRVGPITGATGANDSTISPPVVTVLIDDTPPVASNLLVSTSVGQIDANGYVWDPINPLTVYVTVSDEQDRGDEITLHYWREGIDDTNADGEAQASEYQTQTEPLFPLRSGSQQITFSNIPVSGNGFNGKVSLWLEGTDWAGNDYQDGGTGGAPGLSSDWATLQTAENTETTLLNTGFALDTWDEHILAGQTHTISMVVQDANGVQTLDDIAIYLAGQTNAPLGQFHYDPRDDILTTVAGSHVEPIAATVTPLSVDSSRVEITFSMDWDTPTSEGWYVPGVTVTDDTSIVANLNNLNALRWKLDNVLIATATNLVDLTPPFSDGSATFISVQEGDEIAIEGTVLYGATSMPMLEPSDGLSVIAQFLFGSTVVYQEVNVQEGGIFSAPLVLPDRTPPVQQLPIELLVLNVPGQGSSISNYDSVLVVDSAAPQVVFDQFIFPTSSLLRLESDRLDSVLIDIQIDDSGGMPHDNVTVYWDYYRNGLPRLGVGGAGELAYVGTTDTLYHFSSTLDLRPTDGKKLLEGDQIVFWFEATDLAGNNLQGDGTEDNPRVPLLEIIEFVPVLKSWSIEPIVPEFGESVSIRASFENQGIRSGSINVTLVENIGDTWHVHDSIIVQLTSLDSDASATFEWEAWKSGAAELYIYIDGDLDNRTAVEEFMVAGAPESGGMASTTILLVAVVGLLVIVVIALLGVIIFRKPSESMGEYLDDSWEDEVEESFGMSTNNVRLDYEDDTLWNTVSRYGIYDKGAFLAHAQQYDRDRDGFLDADELNRAAQDFTSMMTRATAPAEPEYPFDYNDETVGHIIDSYQIHDKEAFLHFANAYDEDRNGYLKHSELSRAASDYVESGRNTPPPEVVAPNPRLLAVAEVVAALPGWTDEHVNVWMDKGWTAQQIIEHHTEPVAPPAPEGFGTDFLSSEPMVEAQNESMDRGTLASEALSGSEIEAEVHSSHPTEAQLKRLKKAELVELAELQGLDTSGTKADIIARLVG
tara:strand:- start:3764 stop:10819 length:7056 start_codon:yes stop_codon:yes gene_type:complete